MARPLNLAQRASARMHETLFSADRANMDDCITDIRGVRTPYGVDAEWPARVDQFVEPRVDEAEVE